MNFVVTERSRLKKVSKRMVRKSVRRAAICEQRARDIQQSLKRNISVRRVQNILVERPYLHYVKRKEMVKMTDHHKENRGKWGANTFDRTRRHGKNHL